MRYTLKKKFEIPFLYIKDGIIIEVNEEFINFTGYSRSELIGKSIYEINFMLRLNSQICLENIQDKYSCYMFTQSYEPREVTITCKILECEDEKMYFFREKSNSRIQDKFVYLEQLYADNKIGISIRSFPDLILLRANDKQLDLLDMPYNKRENSIGKILKGTVDGYEGSNSQKFLSKIMKTWKPQYAKQDKYDVFKRGNKYWRISIVPIYIEGKAKYIVITTKEITEKVLNEKFINKQAGIIKEQKEELEAIIENMSDALLIFDKDGNFTNFNKSARDTLLIGFTNLSKIGDSLKKYEYFDVNKQAISYENLPAKRVMNGEKLLGYRIAKKTDNGFKYADINGTPIYDDEGNFIAGILCCRDVTEKIKHEEDVVIKAQYDFLRKVIDNIDLPVIKLSYPDFKVTKVNQKAYNFIKGLRPEIKSISFVTGLDYSYIISSFDKKDKLKHIHDIINKKETSYIKYRRLVSDEEEIFVNIFYQPLIGLGGKVAEVVAIVMDVTEEIKANHHMEKVLKRQEEFLANVSHELKTPLNVIFSTTQLFDLYLKQDSLINNKDKICKYINTMRQNCYRLSRLISNIVDLSKIESGFFQLNISNENIVCVVENIIQSVSGYVKSKELSIIFDTDTEEKIIACDPNKIERVILNLISNAIKFSNPGNEIYVSILDKKDIVEISVRDNGIGIDKNYIDTIFQKFKQVDKSFTRNAEGSGIGLCIVKSIVELHGGKISVESKLGEGSNFKIELPSRTTVNSSNVHKNKPHNNNVEMINVEFSDIYS